VPPTLHQTGRPARAANPTRRQRRPARSDPDETPRTNTNDDARRARLAASSMQEQARPARCSLPKPSPPLASTFVPLPFLDFTFSLARGARFLFWGGAASMTPQTKNKGSFLKRHGAPSNQTKASYAFFLVSVSLLIAVPAGPPTPSAERERGTRLLFFFPFFPFSLDFSRPPPPPPPPPFSISPAHAFLARARRRSRHPFCPVARSTHPHDLPLCSLHRRRLPPPTSP